MDERWDVVGMDWGLCRHFRLAGSRVQILASQVKPNSSQVNFRNVQVKMTWLADLWFWSEVVQILQEKDLLKSQRLLLAAMDNLIRLLTVRKDDIDEDSQQMPMLDDTQRSTEWLSGQPREHLIDPEYAMRLNEIILAIQTVFYSLFAEIGRAHVWTPVT